MKIAVFNPKSEFSEENKKKLFKLGEIVYVSKRKEYPLEKIIKVAENSEIIAIDPDIFGGFDKAKERVNQVAETLPNLKGVALSTTSYGWIDLEYFNKRKIPVSNVPHYSRESVSEHTLAMLLGLAKRILVTDRLTQKGKYKLEMGFELKDKTLGIIGLGNIGSRVAELAQGIGMKVVAFNPTPRKQIGVKMKTFNALLKESDAITLHTIDSQKVNSLINKETIAKMKDGVIIVNTVDRSLVSEKDMATALRRGKVYGYAYEGEDLENTPLSGVENAIGLKGFGWYTKEALANLFNIWVNNIETMTKGKPVNVVT
jgi:glycerate dehydrogenase